MPSIERHIAIRRVGCDPLERCAALTIKAFQLDDVFEYALNNEGELSITTVGMTRTAMSKPKIPLQQ